MELHTAGHRRGVVAAPHHAAAEAGRAILAEGGNALEAMVAMAAAIAAVYPHMNHVGGDGFFLVRERSGRVRALMAAGRAGAKARIELLSRGRLRHDPARGPLAALTAPAAVAGWSLALEVAKAPGGRMPLGDAARSRDPPRPRRLCGHREPGAAHRGEARRARERARFCRDVPRRRQAARGGNRAAAAGARGDASIISPMPGSTISTAATSAARSPPISRGSAARSPAPTSKPSAPRSRSR